jgi:Holliday junction resolvasome RuvABC endonuclease subunit
MEILSLDTATRTGFAHTSAPSGAISFDLKRGESPGMRWLKFRQWLNTFLDTHPTDLIIYELEGLARSRAAAHVAHGFTSIVEAIAAERGIDLTNIGPKVLKKWATNNGNAGKMEMMDAAELIVRRPMNDDNEADAILLLAYAREKYDNAGRPAGL